MGQWLFVVGQLPGSNGGERVNWRGADAVTRGVADVVQPARRTRRLWQNRRRHRRLSRLPAYRQYADRQFDVLLHFPDLPVNLYHARQWYGPLERLAEQRSVAILCYEPESAEIIRQETTLPVLLIRGEGDFDHVQNVHQPKVILYPNQNYANFAMLGLNSCQHAFICHGESDKIYMASNWMKVFNYDLVAGQAAKDRLRRRLFGYDVEARTIEIGRPQIDVVTTPPVTMDPTRTTVIYAPTWEGGRSSMRYGSVVSHGAAIVSAVLADPRCQLIYRPHPRTGMMDSGHQQADENIKNLIHDANSAEPETRHLVDDTPFGWQLNSADVMITDISAVAYDWLTTAKPLIVTLPEDPAAVIDPDTFLADMPLVRSDRASDIIKIMQQSLTDRQQIDKIRHWCAYYYGDTTPGASIGRFMSAVERMINERDAWMQRQHPVADDLAHIGNVGS